MIDDREFRIAIILLIGVMSDRRIPRVSTLIKFLRIHHAIVRPFLAVLKSHLLV